MILAVPKNTLSASQKGTLSKKGYVIIECDDPDKIRVINTETNIDVNDFFMASLYAICVANPSNSREYFINELYKRLKKKEEMSIESSNK